MIGVICGVTLNQKPALASTPMKPPFCLCPFFIFPEKNIISPFFKICIHVGTFDVFALEAEFGNGSLAAIWTI